MPDYQFKVFSGHHTVDPDTLTLPDIATARRECLRRAGAALVLDAPHFQPNDDWRLDVTDENDVLLFRLDVLLTVAPAAK